MSAQSQSFRARWKKVALPNKLTVGCTAIIAAATVWYAIVAHRQWDTMGKTLLQMKAAAETDKERFRVDQRPYVWIANGKAGAPELVRLVDKPGYVQLVWTITLANFGKTPALGLKGEKYVLVRNHSMTQSYGASAAIPALIPPTGEIVTTTLSSPDLTEEDLRSIQARGSQDKVVVWGHYTYTDASGTPYETGLCLSRLNTGAIAYCEGNYLR